METKTTTSSYESLSQEPQPNVWSVGAQGGLYTGLVLILFALVVYIFDYHDRWFGFIYQLFSFSIGIFLTHKAFKEDGDGFMSYGQGIGLASVLGMVGGALLGIFNSIYLTYIDDTVMERAMLQMRTQFEDQGMTDAQIDQAIAMSEMMQGPVILVIATLLSCIFYAFLISLLISAFTKNADPTLEY